MTVPLARAFAIARQYAKISARTAAKRSGYSHSYILNLESGDRTNPTLNALCALIDAYDTPMTLYITPGAAPKAVFEMEYPCPPLEK